jgi:hypothetical protein
MRFAPFRPALGRPRLQWPCLVLPVLLACGSGEPEAGAAVLAHDAPAAALHVFTYSEVRTRNDWAPALQAFRDQALPGIVEQGGLLVGVWHEVPLEDDAPFERLGPNELLVMIAWPDESVDGPSGRADRALNVLDEVIRVRTRSFRSTVRPERVSELSRPGFYVHRLGTFAPDDINEVIRLSVEAWQTFEPTFGAEVMGLFRETPDRDGTAQMLRIAWYRSYEGWQESRMFGRDPSSQERFRARGELRIDSEGYAGALAVSQR